MINNEKYEKIIDCLINPDLCTDANFKYWVLKKGDFSIVDNQLYRFQTRGPKNAKRKINVPVCTVENIFDACYKVHSIERSHVGVVKSDTLLKERYYGITKDVVRIFNKYCFICNLTSIQHSQARLKCISNVIKSLHICMKEGS